jgi:hypothetical protein
MRDSIGSIKQTQSKSSHLDSSSSKEVEELKLKLKCLREENVQIHEAAKGAKEECDQIEAILVETKIRSANLDLEND